MNATHPLGQLIQSIEDGNGWTLRHIARRIESSGMSMSHTHLGNLKNKPIQSVTSNMLEALSVGLGVSQGEVASAALASMGVLIRTEGGGLDVAITRDPALTDFDRRLLRAMVREIRDARRDEHESTDRAQARSDHPSVAGKPQPDGATIHELRPARQWWLEDDVAADSGVRDLDAEDAEAAERGEESQDPEDHR